MRTIYDYAHCEYYFYYDNVLIVIIMYTCIMLRSTLFDIQQRIPLFLILTSGIFIVHLPSRARACKA